MSDDRGLYGKYFVTRTGDGKPVDNCFVLEITDDAHARAALAAYARSVKQENPDLYADLKKWLAEYNLPVDALVEVSSKDADELHHLRDITASIRKIVTYHRRKHYIWQDEISDFDDDVAFLLTDMSNQLSTATDDAAALRAILEAIRNVARKAENDDRDPTDTHLLDLLHSVSYTAGEGLREHKTGRAQREEVRQLQTIVDNFEKGMSETGGWTYSGDRTLADRVRRCIDHYTRKTALSLSEAHQFKNDIVSWLRGIAINAQSVSWASTHHEKDARLRGLIEVIETAITKINEMLVTDSLSSWNSVVDSWMKSDFPTREMRRRILELEEENKRLKEKPEKNQPPPAYTDIPI